MTDLRTAAQQALEALKDYKRSDDDRVSIAMHILDAALRAALAEPVQEPVAWLHVPYPGNAISPMLSLSKHREPSLYAATVPLYIKEQL
jgi:hypothetical protein